MDSWSEDVEDKDGINDRRIKGTFRVYDSKCCITLLL